MERRNYQEWPQRCGCSQQLSFATGLLCRARMLHTRNWHKGRWALGGTKSLPHAYHTSSSYMKIKRNLRMVLERKCWESDKSCIENNCPISDGTAPLRSELPWSHTFSKPRQFPTSVGIVDVMRFLNKESTATLDRKPTSDGMVEEIWLESNPKAIKSESNPISEGTAPLTWLL